MKVFISGGAGFIGSTARFGLLLDAGITPGRAGQPGDPRRASSPRDARSSRATSPTARWSTGSSPSNPDIEAVVHCAALIVVPDSVGGPARATTGPTSSKSLDFVGAPAAQRLRPDGLQLLRVRSTRPGADFSVDGTRPIDAAEPVRAHQGRLRGDVRRHRRHPQPIPIPVAVRYFNPISADPKMRTGLQSAPAQPSRSAS